MLITLWQNQLHQHELEWFSLFTSSTKLHFNYKTNRKLKYNYSCANKNPILMHLMFASNNYSWIVKLDVRKSLLFNSNNLISIYLRYFKLHLVPISKTDSAMITEYIFFQVMRHIFSTEFVCRSKKQKLYNISLHFLHFLNMKIIKIAIKMWANKSSAWRYKLNQKCNLRNAIMP